jgi:hypothetical protein
MCYYINRFVRREKKFFLRYFNRKGGIIMMSIEISRAAYSPKAMELRRRMDEERRFNGGSRKIWRPPVSLEGLAMGLERLADASDEIANTYSELLHRMKEEKQKEEDWIRLFNDFPRISENMIKVARDGQK